MMKASKSPIVRASGRFGTLAVLVALLCPQGTWAQEAGQAEGANPMPGIGEAGLSCKHHPSVDCLSDLAIVLANENPLVRGQVARNLAGAGRFADAYALGAVLGKLGQQGDLMMRIAMQQVAQAARAKPDSPADLGPIESAAAVSHDPQQTLLICLRMVANELLGDGEELEYDSNVLSARGKGALPPVLVPRPTVEAIVARWQKAVPGSPGPVSVLMALGDRQGAEAETERLVLQGHPPINFIAQLWAEVGNVQRMTLAEDKLQAPNASIFLIAADAMASWKDPSDTIASLLQRALNLTSSGQSTGAPREAIKRINEIIGLDAARAATTNAVEQARSAPQRRRPALLANLAEAYLDLREPERAKPLLDEAIMEMPKNIPVPAWFSVPMYRLGDLTRFEKMMSVLDDDRRGEVWVALARERDVSPTMDFGARGSKGTSPYGPDILVEIAMRDLEQGRAREVPPVVKGIIKYSQQSLSNGSSDFYKTGSFDTLAAAARLALAANDQTDAKQALRAIIDAAFANKDRIAVQLSLAASFWHRRMPNVNLTP